MPRISAMPFVFMSVRCNLHFSSTKSFTPQTRPSFGHSWFTLYQEVCLHFNVHSNYRMNSECWNALTAYGRPVSKFKLAMQCCEGPLCSQMQGPSQCTMNLLNLEFVSAEDASRTSPPNSVPVLWTIRPSPRLFELSFGTSSFTTKSDK